MRVMGFGENPIIVTNWVVAQNISYLDFIKKLQGCINHTSTGNIQVDDNQLPDIEMLLNPCHQSNK